MFLELVGDGLQAAEAAVAEEIRQKEPQSDVVIRKCFGLPGLIQGIDSHPAGIQREENLFFVAAPVLAYVIGKPAFHAAALVIISSAALLAKVFPGLEAVDIKVADIRADPVKMLDQFVVFGHGVLRGQDVIKCIGQRL